MSNLNTFEAIIEASITANCEIIVSHGFEIELNEKLIERTTNAPHHSYSFIYRDIYMNI